MQKIKPHLYFLIPCLFISVSLLAISFFKNDGGTFALYATVPCMACAAIYVLSPQIDWWGYKKNPPDVAPGIKQFLEEKFAYYQKLSTENKLKFRRRVALYTIGNEFMRPAPPKDDVRMRNDVPDDLKAAAAACAIQLTFGLTDFMMPPFEHIIIYPSPFPSPQYPNHFHTSEVFADDGVILFSAEPLIQGFSNPTHFYSIGLHEYAKVFKLINPSSTFPQLEEQDWNILEKISMFSRQTITKGINLPHIDPLPVAIHHFFTFPQPFKTALPDVFQLFENIFNQNPLSFSNPIMNHKE